MRKRSIEDLPKDSCRARGVLNETEKIGISTAEVLIWQIPLNKPAVFI